jgi:hypothetical protein
MCHLKELNAMDANVKTILESLNRQIDSNELTAALKADSFEGEYALSEDGIKAITDQVGGLLSVDSAVNNQQIIEKISKDLYPKHMKTALTKVEEQLKPILDKLGVDYSKHEFVSDAISEIEPKLASLSNGESKELVESLNEDLRKAKEALDNKDKEFEEELKKRDQEILNDKLMQKFKSKATEKPWADAYNIPDVKNAILSDLWNKVNAKAYLKLTDDGDIVPMQKEFPDKELYNGNKVETFQSLLEPLFEPYVKKSAPENTSSNGRASSGEEKLSEAEKRRIAEYKRQKERAAAK